MKKRIISRYNHKVILTKNNTKICDSHDLSIKDSIIMAKNIYYIRKYFGYNVKRDVDSYIRELISHNRLYKLGLYRSHTKDCDLEENIKPLTNLIYKILGWY